MSSSITESGPVTGSNPEAQSGSTVQLMGSPEIQQAILDLAEQVQSDHADIAAVVLIGIRTRGVPLAHRLGQQLLQLTGIQPEVGSLDITFFRDDLRQRGLRTPDRSNMPCDLTDRPVVLVDDVIFRGRTIRAAMDALFHFGRPRLVRLAVLVDRGHREFPIQPDYVGLRLETQPQDSIRVHLQEQDGDDQVLLQQC